MPVLTLEHQFNHNQSIEKQIIDAFDKVSEEKTKLEKENQILLKKIDEYEIKLAIIKRQARMKRGRNKYEKRY